MNFWDRPCALRKALFLLTTHTVVYTLEGLQREFVLVEFEVRGLGGGSPVQIVMGEMRVGSRPAPDLGLWHSEPHFPLGVKTRSLEWLSCFSDGAKIG